MNPFEPHDVTLASLNDRIERLERAQRDSEDETLNEQAAAQFIGCSTRELFQAVQQKECACMFIGMKRLYKRAFLREFQKKRTVEAA